MGHVFVGPWVVGPLVRQSDRAYCIVCTVYCILCTAYCIHLYYTLLAATGFGCTIRTNNNLKSKITARAKYLIFDIFIKCMKGSWNYVNYVNYVISI